MITNNCYFCKSTTYIESCGGGEYSVACNNVDCMATGPMLSSRKAAADTWNKASPNGGKVSPEMVENITFRVRKIAIENDLEKHKKLYNRSEKALFRIENDLRGDKDFNNLMERMVKSVLHDLGLEVADG